MVNPCCNTKLVQYVILKHRIYFHLLALLTSNLDESFAVRKLRVNLKRIFSQAEARSLAETYGGKLASEFNSKTSHVIMATGKRKLFFLYKLCEKVKIEVTLLTVPTVAYVEELALAFSD